MATLYLFEELQLLTSTITLPDCYCNTTPVTGADTIIAHFTIAILLGVLEYNYNILKST